MHPPICGRPTPKADVGLTWLLAVLGASLVASAVGVHAAEAVSGRQARCLALVAYTEAAVDGPDGMAAVIQVVRNRMSDQRFPNDACAVIGQVVQFQPVAQSAVLQKVVLDPEGYNIPQVLKLRSPAARQRLAAAFELARAPRRAPAAIGNALYFVNPDLMDPARCAWFAALKRTARIGGHVFMAEYSPDEPRAAPALDCSTAGRPPSD